jgi:hypothetical protein
MVGLEWRTFLKKGIPMFGDLFGLLYYLPLIILICVAVSTWRRTNKQRREDTKIFNQRIAQGTEQVEFVHKFFDFEYMTSFKENEKRRVFDKCILKVPMGRYPAGTKWDHIEVDYTLTWKVALMYNKSDSLSNQVGFADVYYFPEE